MTTSSCEGHVGRVNEGPFVMLGSPDAIELEKQLKNSAGDQEREWLKSEIVKYNLAELGRLFTLLKRFYSSHRPIAGQALTLRTIGYSEFRLNCQGSELAYGENDQEGELRLARNRAEMKAFTEWLKETYFSFDIHDLVQRARLARNPFVGKSTKKSNKVISNMAESVEQAQGVRATFVYDGYFGGANSGPYIVFESFKADEIRRSVVEASDSLTHEERNKLYEEAMRYNTADQRRLYCLLEGFYAQHDIDYEHSLIVQTVGFSNFRLRHQGTEVVLTEPSRSRDRKLKVNRDEMSAFTEYIKSA